MARLRFYNAGCCIAALVLAATKIGAQDESLFERGTDLLRTAPSLTSNRFENFSSRVKQHVFDTAAKHGICVVEHVFSADGYRILVVGDTIRSERLKVQTCVALTRSSSESPLDLPVPGLWLFRTAFAYRAAKVDLKEDDRPFRLEFKETILQTNLLVRVRGNEEWVLLRGATEPGVAEDFISRFFPDLSVWPPFAQSDKLSVVERSIENTNRFIVTFPPEGQSQTSYHYDLVDNHLQRRGIEIIGPCTISRIGFEDIRDRIPR